MWNYVIPHFQKFLQDIELQLEDRKDAEGKAERIARTLFSKYYPNQLFNPSCYLKVGSYGKGTACKPRSDLDMLFILPDEDCGRIAKLQNNKQSQLLQEIKEQVRWTFSTTSLRADGQIVLANFHTYQVDIVPAFRLPDGKYLTAHTKNGGSWGVTDPIAEASDIRSADLASAGKSTHLNKIAKVWKRQCNVEIKSAFLEVMVNRFVEQWEYRNQTIYYYDWMVRDFFSYMLNWINGRVKLAGVTEWHDLGDCWESKCRSAYEKSVLACEYERADWPYSATGEWQKVFGCHFKGSSAVLQALALA